MNWNNNQIIKIDMNFTRNILITGGAGFIGSHVVRLFVNKYPEYHIINLDNDFRFVLVGLDTAIVWPAGYR